MKTVEFLLEVVNKLQHHVQQQQRRLLVLLEGDPDWTLTAAQRWLADVQAQQVLWWSQRAPSGSWCLPPQRINHELGREACHGVFDYYSGANPDALAALAGTISAGGFLLLLAPSLQDWPDFADPYREKIAVEPGGTAAVGSGFLTRAAWVLRQQDCLVRWCQHQGLQLPKLPSLPVVRRQPDAQGCVTEDQRQALQAILRVAQGHRKRPLVLQADRGRGKSAVMGLAVRLLLAQGKRVLVTAPRPESVATLKRFAGDAQDGLQYQAPDQLLQRLPPADLLLVDEAAALSPNLLQRMLDHYSRTVLATTVAGYEGTGRGFVHRFQPHLQARFPGWRLCEMVEPIRWQQQDWLEQTLEQMLLLRASPLPSDSAGSAPLTLETFDYQCPAQQEARLQAVFELLVAAHYRTRPSDLRMLLDGGNLRVFLLCRGSQVLAVALVAQEGMLPADLATEIAQGRRRPHGQVLPQTLAVHGDQPQALQLPLWRVVRIAVQPQDQGEGLGSELLQRLQTLAQAEGVAALGSVFSGTAQVLRFWQQNGYLTLRVGYRPEVTTGGHSLLVLKSLCPESAPLLKAARTAFEADFPHQLLDTHRHLPADLVLAIMHQGQFTVAYYERDQVRLRRYLAGYAKYENVVASLWRCLWHGSARQGRLSLTPGRQLLVMKVMQGLSWADSVQPLGLSGIREAREQLRQAVADWLSPGPNHIPPSGDL